MKMKKPYRFLIALLAGFSASPLLAADVATGQAIFEKKCHACHAEPDLSKTPAGGWEEKLEKMAYLARLKEEQKEDVLAYLKRHSQQEVVRSRISADEMLLKEKCTSCHSLERVYDRLHSDDTTDEAWAHIVSRMQQKASGWITDDESEQLLEFLLAQKAADNNSK